MFRNKYKYSRNHGLLPSVAHKPYNSSITSVAILAPGNSQRDYTLSSSPNNHSMLIMFNERQYLQKQCSFLVNGDSNNVIEEIVRKNDFKRKTLTVYIANDYQQCDKNIIGGQDLQYGLILQTYQDLVTNKKNTSSIVMSITGIQNENNLVDLLVLDRPEQLEYLPNDLKEVPFLKRKIRVSKNPDGHRFFVENGLIETVESIKDLKASINRYKSIKSQIQASKLMSDGSEGGWMQGQLFQFSEVEYDTQVNRITNQIRTHYILRVNQYLRSSAGLMLKLGMNIRHMQERHSSVVVDNSESKLFKILSGCFTKKKQRQEYYTTVIYEVGNYKTIKDEYTNLVPTSELISDKFDLKSRNIESASFLYLKHYHDYGKLVSLLAKMQEANKQTKNIQEYLEESTQAYKSTKMAITNYRKSYVCDTISSIQKKVQRNFMMKEESFENINQLEKIVKRTAKMYRDQDSPPRQKTDNRSSFKKSENKSDQRMSLFEWGSIPKAKSKIYASKNIAGRMSEADKTRKSADCARGNRSTWARANANCIHLSTVYGINSKRNRGLGNITSQKEDNEGNQTKGLVQQIVKKKIIQLGRDEEIYNDDSSDLEVVQ